jgi:TonB family protein
MSIREGAVLRGQSLVISICVMLGMMPVTRPLVARSAETLCAVQLTALPWAAERDGPIPGPSSDRYGLYVFAHAKSAISATILLASDADLYRVSISDGKIFPAKGQAVTPLLVLFKTAVAIHHAYIEELRVDDAPPQQCVALVRSTDDRDGTEMSARLGSLVATQSAEAVAHRAASCANPYTDATVLGIPDEDTQSEDYGNIPRSAVVDVIVATDGTVIKTNISQASGVSGIDAEAIRAATDARYKPATLLCTPVVSEYLFKYEYEPR